MSKSIHNLIKIEYEKKQKVAFDNLSLRKEELYQKVPRLQEIEREIQFSGIRYNKSILLGGSPVTETIKELLSRIGDLKQEKRQLLTDQGYGPDYLDAAYECPQCKDTGFVENNYITEKCSCYKQLFIRHLYSQANLKLAESENFAAFDESYYSDSINEAKYGIKISPRENIARIRERCTRFIESFHSPQEKNLFFTGLTGVGKTFMANCIAYEILNTGKTVLYQTAPGLFNIISENKANAFKDEEYQDESYRNIFDVELLIIDDLGTEPLSAARYAELLNILDIRQNNNFTRPCKTIICTNIGARELREYYDERVASRIIGSFDLFRFIGEDIRMVKKINLK